MGWRKITKRQVHIRKAREKLKKKIAQMTKKTKERERNVVRRRGKAI
jgi:hypothetical protein